MCGTERTRQSDSSIMGNMVCVYSAYYMADLNELSCIKYGITVPSGMFKQRSWLIECPGQLPFDVIKLQSATPPYIRSLDSLFYFFLPTSIIRLRHSHRLVAFTRAFLQHTIPSLSLTLCLEDKLLIHPEATASQQRCSKRGGKSTQKVDFMV